MYDVLDRWYFGGLKVLVYYVYVVLNGLIFSLLDVFCFEFFKDGNDNFKCRDKLVEKILEECYFDGL